MNRKRIWLVWVMIAAFALSVMPPSSISAETDGKTDYDLSYISGKWECLSDEELNDYIGNNNDADLYMFIMSLTEKEREVLRSRDTMLNNTISVDNEDGTFTEMPYYDWIIKNGNPETPKKLRMTRSGTVSTFTAKSGYCFYRFVDSNSGYIVRYKVTFTLASTANAESLTNDYKVGSVIYAIGGENSNNTRLNKVTFEKQKKYMQKAATIHEELSDGSAGEMRDGEKIYPTAITPVFVLTVKVPKPMYTYGEWHTEGFKLDGAEQMMASGSRFNFREYNWQCTGDTTFDNKVYHQEEVNELTSCVNILSCGFTVENTGSLELAEGVPEVDTMNVVYKHPVLNIDYYVNGGEVESTEFNPSAVNPVRRSVVYNKVYSEDYGLPEVAALGFKKAGYKPSAGAEWKTYDGSRTWDETNLAYRAKGLMDFDDGTYFTTKLRAMYVNWEPNIYKVTLDNQGADSSGTEATWYRYNTYDTETLADGTVQKNYFYTTKALTTPLKDGYKIVKPVKEGYTFKGYFTEKNGQGSQYVNSAGSFINQLWKQIGPHTLYASWEKNAPQVGILKIKRNLIKSDYYSSHGDATFAFRIVSDDGNVYYRTISFGAGDLTSAKNGIVTLETECMLPYGNYFVEAMEVSRYENILTSISSGEITGDVKGEFQLSSSCTEVTAVYDGGKTDWQRFSHNDLAVNTLAE